MKYVLGLVVLIGLGLGAYFVLRPGQPPSTAAPHPAASMQAAPPAAPQAAAPAPADCLMPGPAPVPPDGATASEADIKLGHDVIQHFVQQLEDYQACRNSQLVLAAKTVTEAQKQAWISDGNAAVDQANALAQAFSVQLKIYKARQPAPAP